MKLKFTFSSDPCQLAECRRCVRAFLEKCDFDECVPSSWCWAWTRRAPTSSVTLTGTTETGVRLEMERLRDRVRFVLRDYGRSCDPKHVGSR